MSETIAAVAYYRMSSDRQEASIPAQRTEVQAYAARHGYRIIREYRDEGISGDDTEKRKSFLQMRDDAERLGDFTAILCWDQDRFGRFDQLEAGYWIKPLRDAGIHLATVAQGKIDWEDFAGRLIYAVQQEGKHAFLRDMSRNVTRGMLAKAKEGKWLGGKPPYGMAISAEKKLTLGEPRKAQIVRWLFETYLGTDTSLGALAAALNEQTTLGPGGKLWHKTSVQKILRCPLYTGAMVWNRRHDGKYHGVRQGEIAAIRKAKTNANDAKDWVWVRDTHDAIVSEDMWEKAQDKMIRRRQNNTPVRGGGNFLFTRLVFCAHCGSPMHGLTNTQAKNGKTHRYRRYICGKYNAHGKHGCQCNTITERQLVNAIANRIQQTFLEPANLRRLRHEIKRQIREAGQPIDLASVNKQITALDEKIDKALERLLTMPADLVPALTRKVQAWQSQRDDMRPQLAAAAKAKASAVDENEIVDSAIKKLSRLTEEIHGADPTKVRELIRQVVCRIECLFDHVPIGNNGRLQSRLRKGTIHVRPDAFIRVVPSGLARGIDAAVHRGALRAGGRTVAVLAGGLAKIYPPEHDELAEQVKEHGALLSESAMKMEPMAALFPARNRIISGLSRGVILIEAGEKSGALITASHAAEQGREVFAIPGQVDSPASAGTLELLRKGAKLVRHAQDVIEDLQGIAPLFATKPNTRQAALSQPPVGLEPLQQKVWDFIDQRKYVDEIARHVQLSVGELSQVLMMLEMKKVVRRLPGNQYERW